MLKYPRTPHLLGSKLQPGDHDLQQIPFSAVEGRHLVVEEKVDGANCGISFSRAGELQLQSRGHYLRGGPSEKQFALFKQWAAAHTAAFWAVLSHRYVMYGEWLFAQHTVGYDALPSYFLEFDVLDTETDAFLSTVRRQELLHGGPVKAPILSVPMLYQGPVTSVAHIQQLAHQPSAFFSAEKIAELRRKSLDQSWMEGVYLKAEDANQVLLRFKYVRHSFDSEEALSNPKEHIIQNQLRPGALDAMFLPAD
jgi:hypothetical protein